MSVLINEQTRVLFGGFTGKQGTFHAEQAIAYGTKVVGGITPGKGGTTHLDLPVFNNSFDAVEATQANAIVLFVPAPYCKSAAIQSLSALHESSVENKLLIIITEGIPNLDMLYINEYQRCWAPDVRIIGPNCPGVIRPGECKIGIMPGHIHRSGRVGIVSRSGTLTYEVVYQTTKLGFGQSLVIGIGGDPLAGTDHVEALKMLQEDATTEAIVMIGEIGGTGEEKAAEFIKHHITKPVFAYIAGVTAPPGKRMGHAGAIISGGKGTAADKMAALEAAGVHVVRNMAKIGDKIADITGW
jgi:succinyl-CoA synthetase alpha subunit